jgi:hypothetical protein
VPWFVTVSFVFPEFPTVIAPKSMLLGDAARGSVVLAVGVDEPPLPEVRPPQPERTRLEASTAKARNPK